MGCCFDSVRLAHPDTVFTDVDLLTGYVAARRTLSFQPGERWEYQNANFAFLGLILVETITGRSVDDYITEREIPATSRHDAYLDPRCRVLSLHAG